MKARFLRVIYACYLLQYKAQILSKYSSISPTAYTYTLALHKEGTEAVVVALPL